MPERALQERDPSQDAGLYRSILGEMPYGIACCRVLFEAGKPKDFLCLMANEAFVRQTGLKDIAGKKISDVLLDIFSGAPELVERYAGVATSGEPAQFEAFSQSAQRWYEISAFSPRAEHLVAILKDVTERKQAEEALKESEDRCRRLADAMPHLVWVARPDGFIEHFNSRCYEYTGYKKEEVDNENEIWPRLIHPDDYERVIDGLKQFAVKTTETQYDEYRILGQDGNYRWFMERTVPILDDDGKVVRWFGSCTDIHEKKQAEEAQKLAAMVYQASSEAMMVTDADNRIVTVNPAFEQITGYPAAEVTGRNASLIFSGIHEKSAFEAMVSVIHATDPWKGELWSQRKDGQMFAILLTVNSSHHPDGSVSRRVFLFSDITERKQSDEIIWNQANFDALTGLPNRRFFRDRLQHEIRNARRSGLPMALMFIDLDSFKYVNDTLGHDMGDILLKEAANRLFSCVRETDTVARMGGDEFTVILPELQDASNIERIARHILRVLSEPIRLGEERAYVSASIGITLYPQDATDAEELVKNADQAMYAAKEGGKNRYHYFTPEMQEEAVRRMRIINDMRGALQANQFEIVYQPIVELSSGAIHKAEALIRWQHPTRGLINPVEFISAAEDTGIVTSFGNWIFWEAARQASLWRERYHPAFQISVNISPVQFRNEGIEPSVWLGHLRSLGLPGQGVVVEITEGLLLEANSKVTEQLLMLRDAGIEVALDDFGTGYSSLSYLKKFDIDYIKIDRTFVSNLSEGSDDMALCEAIIAMAHRLGIRVIAEGVETPRQHELLANGGCDFAQGYLFSRPVPAKDFERLLENRSFNPQETLDV